MTPPLKEPLRWRSCTQRHGTSSGATSAAAYTTDWIAVRARNGSAEVVAPSGSRSIADGQGVIIDTAGAIRDATATELSDAFAWVDGNLTITGQPLSEAIKRIRRWYGMELNVKDKELLTPLHDDGGRRRVRKIIRLVGKPPRR